MDKKRKWREQNPDLSYPPVNEIASHHGGDLASESPFVISISRKDDTTRNTGGVSVGFPRFRWLLFMGDLLLVMFANFLSTWIRFGMPLNTLKEYTVASFITIVIYPVTLYIFDLYNVERSFRSWEMAYRSAFAVTAGGLVAMIAFYLVPYGPYGRGIMAIEVLLVWGLFNIWRFLYGLIFQKTAPRVPALIVGAGACGRAIYEVLKSPLSPYEIRGFLDDDPAQLGKSRSPTIMGSSRQITEIARKVGVHTAILAIPKNRSASLIRNILDARLQGINIRDMADVYEELTGRIPVRNIGDQWLLFAEGFYLLHKEYIQKFKRLMDLITSGLFLLFIAPLMGLIALAVKLDSPGPVLYSQRRMGKGQQIFTIYKFRSMRHDAETEGVRWAQEKDPRVTKIGRFLRLTHMDEIPQIWNIFKGDMSLVGPRPERPEFVALLEKEVPYYFARHSVKPGMTGWAQINYQYGASIEDAKNKLEYDIYYVKNMSLMLDFKILLRTIGVVLLSDGAR
ncbi:MAG TPA: sugar transferase [Syntrophorhabdaceae bacterium]|nr:sugar transferase [Syntrophorhabdaceae bacterium]